jgi:hypothetical protein
MQNAVPVALNSVLIFYHVFLIKEGYMNKRIVAISIFLLMMCAMAISVFANDPNFQYEYSVSITFERTSSTGGRNRNTQTFLVWASSTDEAMALAKEVCEWDHGKGSVISCGFPVPTGKQRPR